MICRQSNFSTFCVVKATLIKSCTLQYLRQQGVSLDSSIGEGWVPGSLHQTSRMYRKTEEREEVLPDSLYRVFLWDVTQAEPFHLFGGVADR